MLLARDKRRIRINLHGSATELFSLYSLKIGSPRVAGFHRVLVRSFNCLAGNELTTTITIIVFSLLMVYHTFNLENIDQGMADFGRSNAIICDPAVGAAVAGVERSTNA